MKDHEGEQKTFCILSGISQGTSEPEEGGRGSGNNAGSRVLNS